MKRKPPPAGPQWGYSFEHDQILNRCIASGRTCPFGCVKNGAPNCFANTGDPQRAAVCKGRQQNTGARRATTTETEQQK